MSPIDPLAVPRPDAGPRISVVVVAYGADPWLDRSVRAILASEGVDADVVLVDNGGTEGAVDRLELLDDVTVVRPDHNTGFAGGCNLGVAASRAPIVALVNPDAIVELDALRHLAEAVRDPTVGIATASVRLADRRTDLNCAGNDVHFLGISWSGFYGEPAADHAVRADVTAASGAGMAFRRAVWDTLGGFAEEFFAYYEDADLSLRAWQRGWRVVYVPEAVIVHRYEFSRNLGKFELLERNRLSMVLTVFGRRHLLAIAPLAVALEMGLLVMSLREGWWSHKLDAYRWLFSHRRWLRERRRAIQSARVVDDSAMAPLFVAHLAPGNLPDAHAPAAVERMVEAYWTVARRYLRAG